MIKNNAHLKCLMDAYHNSQSASSFDVMKNLSGFSWIKFVQDTEDDIVLLTSMASEIYFY